MAVYTFINHRTARDNNSSLTHALTHTQLSWSFHLKGHYVVFGEEIQTLNFNIYNICWHMLLYVSKCCSGRILHSETLYSLPLHVSRPTFWKPSSLIVPFIPSTSIHLSSHSPLWRYTCWLLVSHSDGDELLTTFAPLSLHPSPHSSFPWAIQPSKYKVNSCTTEVSRCNG